MTINKPLVIDIYAGDNSSVPQPIDFVAVAGAGYVAVIHKASEGTGHVDALYAIRRPFAIKAGLLWGAYHYYHGGGADEADFFLSCAKPDATTLVALDWESLADGSAPSASSARAFCERIEDKLGRMPVIYSGNIAKEKIDGNDPYFGKHRLWLAQYSRTWTVQESWQTPWLWQNNGDGFGPGPHTVPGIVGNVDNNTIVNPMAVDELKAQWAI